MSDFYSLGGFISDAHKTMAQAVVDPNVTADDRMKALRHILSMDNNERILFTLINNPDLYSFNPAYTTYQERLRIVEAIKSLTSQDLGEPKIIKSLSFMIKNSRELRYGGGDVYGLQPACAAMTVLSKIDDDKIRDLLIEVMKHHPSKLFRKRIIDDLMPLAEAGNEQVIQSFDHVIKNDRQEDAGIYHDRIKNKDGTVKLKIRGSAGPGSSNSSRIIFGYVVEVKSLARNEDFIQPLIVKSLVDVAEMEVHGSESAREVLTRVSGQNEFAHQWARAYLEKPLKDSSKLDECWPRGAMKLQDIDFVKLIELCSDGTGSAIFISLLDKSLRSSDMSEKLDLNKLNDLSTFINEVGSSDEVVRGSRYNAARDITRTLCYYSESLQKTNCAQM